MADQEELEAILNANLEDVVQRKQLEKDLNKDLPPARKRTMTKGKRQKQSDDLIDDVVKILQKAAADGSVVKPDDMFLPKVDRKRLKAGGDIETAEENVPKKRKRKEKKKKKKHKKKRVKRERQKSGSSSSAEGSWVSVGATPRPDSPNAQHSDPSEPSRSAEVKSSIVLPKIASKKATDRMLPRSLKVSAWLSGTSSHSKSLADGEAEDDDGIRARTSETRLLGKKDSDAGPRSPESSGSGQENAHARSKTIETPRSPDPPVRSPTPPVKPRPKKTPKAVAPPAEERMAGGNSPEPPPAKPTTSSDDEDELPVARKPLAAKGTAMNIKFGKMDKAANLVSTLPIPEDKRPEEGEIVQSEHESDASEYNVLDEGSEGEIPDLAAGLAAGIQDISSSEHVSSEDAELRKKERKQRRKARKYRRKRRRESSAASRSEDEASAQDRSERSASEQPKKRSRRRSTKEERRRRESRSASRSRSRSRSGSHSGSRSRSRTPRSRSRSRYSRSRSLSPDRRHHSQRRGFFRDRRPHYDRHYGPMRDGRYRDDRNFGWRGRGFSFRGRGYRDRGGPRMRGRQWTLEDDRRRWDYKRPSYHSRRRYSRSRSRSRRRSRSRSRDSYSDDGRRRRYRSTTRPRSPAPEDDQVQIGESEGETVTKKELYEIAKANVSSMLQSGTIQQIKSMSIAEIAQIRSGGKSVDELVEHCRNLAEKQAKRDEERGRKADDSDSDSSRSDEPRRRHSSEEKDFTFRHPFAVKPAAAITMNISNATSVPIKTPQERARDELTLRLSFPVSSGQQHRATEGVITSDWVPVEEPLKAITSAKDVPALPAPPPLPPVSDLGKTVPASAQAEAEESVEEAGVAPLPPPPEPPASSLSDVVNQRLRAIRALQADPNDVEALKLMHNTEELVRCLALVEPSAPYRQTPTSWRP